MQQKAQATHGIKVMEDTASHRTARCDERRRKLIATARRLFANQGFHLTGVSQIARESGIAVGQIYRDFASKEAVIAAICEESLQVWLEEETLNQAIAEDDKATIADWITHLLQEEYEFEERRMLMEIMAESGRSESIAQINACILGRFRPQLNRALTSIAPHLDESARTLIINLVQVLSWGIAAGEQLDPAMDRAALRTYVTTLVRREIGID